MRSDSDREPNSLPMPHRRVSLRVVLSVVAAIALVAGAGYLALRMKPTAKYAIRVAYLPIVVSSPFFVAQEQGYFREEGLVIEAQKFASSNQMLDALLTDKTDVVMSLAQSLAATAEAKQAGALQVFLANAQNSRQYLSSLIVRVDSDIRNPANLKGKRIGCFPGQTARVYLEITLEKQGLNPKTDVNIQELDPGLHLQALESRNIDALLTYEPTTTIALERGIARPLILGAFEKSVIDPWVGGVFVFRSGFATEYPDSARAFVRAMEKSVSYIRANSETYRLLLPKYTPIDAAIAQKTTNIPYWTLSEMDRAHVQKQTDMLFDRGILPRRVDTTAMYYQP